MKNTISLFLFLFFTQNLFAQVSSRSIMENMFASINNVETLQFKLKKAERVAGELKYGEQDVKFNRTPKKIYTYIHKPNAGVELLFIEGQNDNKALINPNGFPFINVNLDPYGSNMRKGNHHTIYEVGFDYIGSIMKKIHNDKSLNYDEIFLYKGIVKFDNKDCYQIIIDYKPYSYIEYKVQSGESLVDIAYKNFISDFMILEKNPSIKEYENVKPGQIITIPNAYAQKTILFIDKKTHLPIVQKMYDEKGLYEQYEFFNLALNLEIKQEEFKPNYKEYSF
jgi:hypothetical protein